MKKQKICICVLTLAALPAVSACAMAQTTQAGASQQPPLMDRQKEIALALSACPPALADKAAVYVLEKSGYVKVRDSENGFTAIVGHLLPTSVEPQCMSAEAARTHIPPILKIAELRAQGKNPAEIKSYMADAFAKGVFPQATKLSVDYMLSTENLPPSNAGTGVPEHYPPHVMFFAPGVTNADLGVNGSDDGIVLVAAEGGPQAVIIVPVATHAGMDGMQHSSAEGGSK
jgi:hypothetical protein